MSDGGAESGKGVNYTAVESVRDEGDGAGEEVEMQEISLHDNNQHHTEANGGDAEEGDEEDRKAEVVLLSSSASEEPNSIPKGIYIP